MGKCGQRDRTPATRRSHARVAATVMTLPKSEHQYAQGYVYAAARTPRRSLTVNLNARYDEQTAPASAFAPWTITNRSTGDTVSQTPKTNTVSGQPEPYFCTQGAPASKGPIDVHISNKNPNSAGDLGTKLTAVPTRRRRAQRRRVRRPGAQRQRAPRLPGLGR